MRRRRQRASVAQGALPRTSRGARSQHWLRGRQWHAGGRHRERRLPWRCHGARARALSRWGAVSRRPRCRPPPRPPPPHTEDLRNAQRVYRITLFMCSDSRRRKAPPKNRGCTLEAIQARMFLLPYPLPILPANQETNFPPPPSASGSPARVPVKARIRSSLPRLGMRTRTASSCGAWARIGTLGRNLRARETQAARKVWKGCAPHVSKNYPRRTRRTPELSTCCARVVEKLSR